MNIEYLGEVVCEESSKYCCTAEDDPCDLMMPQKPKDKKSDSKTAAKTKQVNTANL